MSEVDKKIIYYPDSLRDKKVEDMLLSVEAIAHSELSDVKDNYHLCIVNHPSENVWGLKTLAMTGPSDVDKYFQDGIIFFDKNLLKNPFGTRLWTHYFYHDIRLDLKSMVTETLMSTENVRIMDYLSQGYFLDLICKDVYLQHFDFFAIRKFLIESFEFSFVGARDQILSLPFGVEYGHSDEYFTMMLTYDCSVKDKKEMESYLRKSEFMSNWKLANHLDIYYLEKTQKLIIMGSWYKSDDMRFFHAFSYQSIAGVKNREHNYQPGFETGIKVDGDLKPKFDLKKLTPRQEQKMDEDKFALARRFALFIKNYRSREADPKKAHELTIIDIDQYLEFYPRQQSVKELNDDNKEFILKMIKDERLFNGLASIAETKIEKSVNEKAEDVVRIIGDKKLEDVVEIVHSGSGNSWEDDITRVKGWIEQIDEETQMVKGWLFLPDDKKWEIKRDKIAEKLKDEIIRVKGEGRNIIKEDIVRIVGHISGFPEDQAKLIVQSVFEEAVEEELKSEYAPSPAIKVEQEIERKSAQENIAQRDVNISRMKKIMDAMKVEIAKIKEVTAQRDELLKKVELLESHNSVHAASTEETKYQTSVKDGEIKLLQDQLDQKEKKIIILEERIALSGKETPAQSGDVLETADLFKLQNEVRSLTVKLDIANRKIKIMQENAERRENAEEIGENKELDMLKSKLQFSQNVIQRFKEEKDELSIQLKVEKEKNKILSASKKDDHVTGVSDFEIAKRDQLIASLTSEKKMVEDRLKENSLEVKKLEQKLKIITVQFEEMSKKKGGNKSASEMNTSKQVEMVNAKLNEANSELGEKKKEVIRQKSEITLLQSKILDLERKIQQLERKAS